MSEMGANARAARSRTAPKAAHLSRCRFAAAETALNLGFDLIGQPGRILVRIGGELDMATAPLLRDALLPLVNERTADIVLDLDEVTFLGSTGLSALVDAWRRAQQTGATLRMIATSSIVHRPLTLTGLDEVFQLYRTVAELPPVTASHR